LSLLSQSGPHLEAESVVERYPCTAAKHDPWMVLRALDSRGLLIGGGDGCRRLYWIVFRDQWGCFNSIDNLEDINCLEECHAFMPLMIIYVYSRGISPANLDLQRLVVEESERERLKYVKSQQREKLQVLSQTVLHPCVLQPRHVEGIGTICEDLWQNACFFTYVRC
jgi:hypothetical protein